MSGLPRLGFLGCGWIGRHRMAAIVEAGAGEAAAIVEPDPAALAAAREAAPGARVFPSLDVMLAEPLDGVVIATPSALHAPQAIAALEAGKAVFCQKPLGRDAAEAGLVVKAAREADRLLGVDLSYRETAAVAAIRDLLESGQLGRIHFIDLVFHNAYGPDKPWFYDPAQSGGGCLMDLGVHLADLALWLLGYPEVEAVSANLRNAGEPWRPGTCEDFASAELRLSSGIAVRLACSWRLHAGCDAVIEATFHGTQGAAALRNVAGSFYDLEAYHWSGTTSRRIAAPPDAWGGRAAAAWAARLAADPRFNPEAERLTVLSGVLDRIYAQANTGEEHDFGHDHHRSRHDPGLDRETRRAAFAGR